MKINAEKNLTSIATLEDGWYRYRWSADVETIQEAYDFLDIWDDNLALPIQEKLISCWDQAYRCAGWAIATEDLLISPTLEIDFCCWIDDPASEVVHLSMEARLNPKQE